MWKTKFGKCIYESPSGYKVYQNLLYRWLTLGSPALQTVIHRYRPHKPILRYIPALTLMARHYPDKACLLGLGGAGVPLMLCHQENPSSLVAVDISEEVIDIAKRFFITDPLKNFTIIHENAANYVKNTQETYPHLMVDLYNANHFPPECNDENFFSSCKKIVQEDGFFVINLANHKEQWSIFQLVKQQFQHTLVIPIRKTANMVIIASNCQSKESFLNKIQRTKEIKRVVLVENWGYVGEFQNQRPRK